MQGIPHSNVALRAKSVIKTSEYYRLGKSMPTNALGRTARLNGSAESNSININNTIGTLLKWKRELNTDDCGLNNVGEINRKSYYRHGLPIGGKSVYNGVIKYGYRAKTCGCQKCIIEPTNTTGGRYMGAPDPNIMKPHVRLTTNYAIRSGRRSIFDPTTSQRVNYAKFTWGLNMVKLVPFPITTTIIRTTGIRY